MNGRISAQANSLPPTLHDGKQVLLKPIASRENGNGVADLGLDHAFALGFAFARLLAFFAFGMDGVLSSHALAVSSDTGA